jgi:hypothetical protein
MSLSFIISVRFSVLSVLCGYNQNKSAVPVLPVALLAFAEFRLLNFVNDLWLVAVGQ